MMNQLLGISKSGLHAFQYAMDTVANDLANVQSTGYKGRDVQFTELMENMEMTGDRLLLDDAMADVRTNSGARSEDYQLNLTQGSLVESQGEHQYAIVGEGFFRVTDPAGETFYTRDGDFQQNADGRVTNARGEALYRLPDGTVPLFQAATFTPVGENKYVAAGAVVPATGTVQEGFLENANVDLATLFSEMMILQRGYAMNIRAAQSTDEMMSGINQFKQ